MKIVRLTQDHIFKPFDCGEADLNDFLLQDAKQYLKGLLAVTYIVEDENSTVAFFSLSNDRISLAKPLRKENEGDTIPMYYDLTQLI